MGQRTQAKLKEFFRKAKKKAKLETELTELNKQINIDTQELYDLMTEEGIDSMKIDGIEFKPDEKPQYSFNIPDGLKPIEFDGFLKWLKKEKYDGIIKTQPNIHPQTLTATLNKHIEQGKQLPEFIEMKTWNYIKYNKSAVERMVKE